MILKDKGQVEADGFAFFMFFKTNEWFSKKSHRE